MIDINTRTKIHNHNNSSSHFFSWKNGSHITKVLITRLMMRLSIKEMGSDPVSLSCGRLGGRNPSRPCRHNPSSRSTSPPPELVGGEPGRRWRGLPLRRLAPWREEDGIEPTMPTTKAGGEDGGAAQGGSGSGTFVARSGRPTFGSG